MKSCLLQLFSLFSFLLFCLLLLLKLLFGHVIASLLIAGALTFKHFVNHVLDVTRSGFFFDFGPVLHDGVLELHK